MKKLEKCLRELENRHSSVSVCVFVAVSGKQIQWQSGEGTEHHCDGGRTLASSDHDRVVLLLLSITLFTLPILQTGICSSTDQGGPPVQLSII